jgi:hypothetical protein
MIGWDRIRFGLFDAGDRLEEVSFFVSSPAKPDFEEQPPVPGGVKDAIFGNINVSS